ncbi:hypothetical protein IWQ61_002256 [Dispira simplex]|nr:hypothetical protein IWQ61_002256 [Dispira simplex]
MADDGPLLRISPSEFHFVPAEGAPGGYVGRLVIKNLRSSAVGFKFKTNAPEKFSVKPVYGALHALDESVEVTASRSRKRFSWLSVLEVPFMTLQLVVYLLYHFCRHVAQYYDRFFTKPQIRRQLLVVAVCVIVVLGALSIKRFLFLPSKRLLSDTHSDPITSPQST